MTSRDFNLPKALNDYYQPPNFEKNTTSTLPFTAYINKNNAVTLLKYLSFASIITPLAIGISHLHSVAVNRMKYGFEVVAFKGILPGQLLNDIENHKAIIPKSVMKIIEEVKKETQEEKNKFLTEDRKRTFKAADGTKLEGAYLKGTNPDKTELPPTARTMIYFVGNSENFANELNTPLTKTFLDGGYNIIFFNYRGVGDSQGKATKEGLYQDADAVYAYARSLGVESSDILLYGHSIGAGIASHVAFEHPEVKFCHERSFSQLDKAGESIVKSAVGFLAGKATAFAIRYFDLNIDSVPGFSSGAPADRLAVYHPGDEVLDQNSRLTGDFEKPAGEEEPGVYALTPRNENSPHNRALTQAEASAIYFYFNPF